MTASVQYSAEVGTYDAGSLNATITYTGPDFAAMRRALLAEARAWRRCAEIAATTPVYAGVDTWTQREHTSSHFRGTALWDAMLKRNRLHAAYFVGIADSPAESRDVAILRALFLALECEDEAAALKPRRSSGKRPAGGKK